MMHHFPQGHTVTTASQKPFLTPPSPLPAPTAPSGVIGGAAHGMSNSVAFLTCLSTRFIRFTQDFTPWSTKNICSFNALRAVSHSEILPMLLPMLSGGRPVRFISSSVSARGLTLSSASLILVGKSPESTVLDLRSVAAPFAPVISLPRL